MTDIKDRLRRLAKHTDLDALHALTGAIERIEELEREVLDLKVANDELIAENHEAVAAERERQSDRIEELEAEVNHFKKLWANAEIDAAAYRSGYRDD